MHAVLEVDLEARAVRPLQHLIDPGRAVALRGFGIFGQREGDGPWMEGSQCLLDWFDFEFRGVSLLGS